MERGPTRFRNGPTPSLYQGHHHLSGDQVDQQSVALQRGGFALSTLSPAADYVWIIGVSGVSSFHTSTNSHTASTL